VFVRADFPVGEKSHNSDTRRSLKLHRVIKRGAQAGCREALAGARLMSERIPELNASLQAELDRPLRIGVGIHCGPTIVGEMGYGNAAAITAIGDAVNTASRLESLTKNFVCELVVPRRPRRAAFPRREIGSAANARCWRSEHSSEPQSCLQPY
jgi:class 3 adenylate cyclase